jgi:hypothetical protein
MRYLCLLVVLAVLVASCGDEEASPPPASPESEVTIAADQSTTSDNLTATEDVSEAETTAGATSGGGDSTDDGTASGATSASEGSAPAGPTTAPESAPGTDEVPGYLATLTPGTPLPSEQACADKVLADPSVEVRPENATANSSVGSVSVVVDGAGQAWNDRNAARVTGSFTGTTEQILRWGACKWGLDEDITRARAVTESSWRVSTEGDVTEDGAACATIGVDAPCAQSYGLLQVKGTVHDGTFPSSATSSAFGVDYAMAWLRACFEGEFTWFDTPAYGSGDEWGCVGAWFSGLWWDESAANYVAEVRQHLIDRTWTTYG